MVISEVEEPSEVTTQDGANDEAAEGTPSAAEEPVPETEATESESRLGRS